MKLPFFRYRVDLNDPKSVRENATYLPSAEGAWPIRGGPRRSREELQRIQELSRRYRGLPPSSPNGT
jgi:hypothetical protein